MTIQEQLTTTVSTKGQIVLPSYIRQSRHWGAGTRLVVEDTPEGVLLKPAPNLKETNIKDVWNTEMVRQAQNGGRNGRSNSGRREAAL